MEWVRARCRAFMFRFVGSRSVLGDCVFGVWVFFKIVIMCLSGGFNLRIGES